MGFAFRILIVSISLGFYGSLHAKEYRITAEDSISTPYSELFDSDEILQLTLKGDMRKPLHDKSQKPKFYPLTLTYHGKDDSQKSLSIEVKARGNYRRLRGNCTYAPLMLKFMEDEATQTSIFYSQRELKLVMPCKGDEYVIREWLIYKLYNLFTPLSFKARLVKVQLEEEGKAKNDDSFYGILLEDETKLAERNGLVSLKRKMKPYQTQVDQFNLMAVFEYLIGNTDWSVQYRQNIKLLYEGNAKLPFTVPYDFDHAGIVDAPYARPTKELGIKSVRERIYRGFCVEDLDKFAPIVDRFKELKKEIYALYEDSDYLDQAYIQSTVLFLDDFYATLNDENAWREDFGYPCDPKGTGNVVIKGLKDN